MTKMMNNKPLYPNFSLTINMIITFIKEKKVKDSKDENNMNNSKINKKLKLYQTFCYNAMCDSKNEIEKEYKD